MVADIVQTKSDKLRDGYKRFDDDCLLIYQNQTLPLLDLKKAAGYALSKVAPLLDSSGFRKVYVDDGQRILELTATVFRIL